MTLTITPYALKNVARSAAMIISTDPIDERKASDFDKRQSFEFEGSPEDGATEAWRRFQNIDDDHIVPDGGRSLVIGDLACVSAPGEDDLWYVFTLGGLIEVSAPEREINCGQCEGTGTIRGGLSGNGLDEECPVCDGNARIIDPECE